MTQKRIVDEFLAQPRFAMIGASRNPRDFSRSLLREFARRGYDVVPVHPQAAEIEGRPCSPSLASVHPPVDSVLLMTSPRVTEEVVRDCAAAGVKRIWMYRAAGKGAVSLAAVEWCQKAGIDVIPGECPMMFLPGTGLMHRLHGFVKRIAKAYPR